MACARRAASVRQSGPAPSPERKMGMPSVDQVQGIDTPAGPRLNGSVGWVTACSAYDCLDVDAARPDRGRGRAQRRAQQQVGPSKAASIRHGLLSRWAFTYQWPGGNGPSPPHAHVFAHPSLARAARSA